jgi:hypothetical protein
MSLHHTLSLYRCLSMGQIISATSMIILLSPHLANVHIDKLVGFEICDIFRDVLLEIIDAHCLLTTSTYRCVADIEQIV